MTRRDKGAAKAKGEAAKLTVKQQLFVEAYLGRASGNATEAARLAGYKGNDVTLGAVGAQNLKNPQIAAAVAARLQAAKDCMQADEVLGLLTDHARGSISDFLRIDARGGFDFDFAAAKSAGKLHLLKSVQKSKKGTRVTMYDAQSALEKLGRYHKLFTDNLVIGGKIGFLDAIREAGSDGDR